MNERVSLVLFSDLLGTRRRVINRALTTLAWLALYLLCALLAQGGGALAAWLSQPETTSQRPIPSLGHALAYDEKRGRVVLFGCSGADRNSLNETWEWDGRRWLKVSSAGPIARKWPAMAYDAKRGRVILFGGRVGLGSNSPSVADTWEWDGQTWRQLNVNGPSERDHHVMVYDRRRERIVLFGGWNGKEVLGDTWEWDGARWLKVVAPGPVPRAAASAVYDERRGVILLVGGRRLEQFFNDTWYWDGLVWQQVAQSGPSPRAFPALAYDPHRRKTFLFGGRNNEQVLGDTWEWDGARWRQLNVSGPSNRGVYAAAYDRRRRLMIFFGGGDRVGEDWRLHDDTWQWDGQAWHKADGR
jgi:hypothetical protein